jgi:hypothetical protein
MSYIPGGVSSAVALAGLPAVLAAVLIGVTVWRAEARWTM